jgi:hypothetical protein
LSRYDGAGQSPARDRAIEAAARACNDDGPTLAALGNFLWAFADRGDVLEAQRALLDAVCAAGGDWEAVKIAVAQVVTPQVGLILNREDDRT